MEPNVEADETSATKKKNDDKEVETANIFSQDEVHRA